MHVNLDFPNRILLVVVRDVHCRLPEPADLTGVVGVAADGGGSDGGRVDARGHVLVS